jgi:hypothetical protein
MIFWADGNRFKYNKYEYILVVRGSPGMRRALVNSVRCPWGTYDAVMSRHAPSLCCGRLPGRGLSRSDRAIIVRLFGNIWETTRLIIFSGKPFLVPRWDRAILRVVDFILGSCVYELHADFGRR